MGQGRVKQIIPEPVLRIRWVRLFNPEPNPKFKDFCHHYS